MPITVTFKDFNTCETIGSLVDKELLEVCTKLNEFFNNGYELAEIIENYEFGLHITYKLRKKEE